VQKTASSITVRSGSELRDQGRYTLGQMLEDVAGITGDAAGAPAPGGSGADSAAPGLTIRGMRSNLGAVGNISAVASAAAVYVDGVYEGVGGGYDIDRVEFCVVPRHSVWSVRPQSCSHSHTRPRVGWLRW
jgi:iron complex outermembrane receptor protein